MSQGTTPPGWYDDGRGAQRWWDGQRWTEHLQAAPQGPPPPPPGHPGPGWQSPRSSGPGRGLLWGLVGGGVVLLAVVAVVLVIVFGGDDDSDDDTAGDPAGQTPSAQSTDGDAGGATASEAPAPLATPETSPAPPLPEPSVPSGGSGAGSESIESMTCGEIRAMSTDQLVEMLDTAATLDAATDDSAQQYLDLPDSSRRVFAESLPAACLGEADGTTIGELDAF